MSETPADVAAALNAEDLNMPVRSTPYTQELNAKGGVVKLDTGKGNIVRINPVTYSVAAILCGHCGSAKPRMACCGGCKRTPYCSKECQRAAWPEHKKMCKQMSTTTCSEGDGSNPEMHNQMKWLAGVPNFAKDLRKAVDAKPGRTCVPLFLVTGGSNPYVAKVQEMSDDPAIRESAIQFHPDLKHWLREDAAPLPDGRKRVVLMINRNEKATLARMQV
jgi:hypothetical protein